MTVKKTVAKKSVTKKTVAKKSVTKKAVAKKAIIVSKKITPKQMVSRNQKIQKLYKTGKYTVRSLATKVGLSKTRVGEIIKA